jgi:hypothetical protein
MKKAFGSLTGAIIPEELKKPDGGKCAGVLQPGDYGWAAVRCDSTGAAFLPINEQIREAQLETAPHLIQVLADGSFTARLMSQQVERVDVALAKSTYVIPVKEVEF